MDAICSTGVAGGFQRASKGAGWIRQVFIVNATILGLSCFALPCFGQLTRSVVLGWDAAPAPEMVIGYRLYYGEQPGKYTAVTNLPAGVRAIVPGLTVGRTYYFALAALNRAGIQSEFSDEIVFEVPSLNTPPMIYGSGDQVMEQDSSLMFSIGALDAETRPGDLRLEVATGDPEILPLSNIVIEGESYVRSVTVTPRLGYVGPVQLVLSVADGQGGEATESLTVLVVPLNRPPTLDPIDNVVVAEDSGLEAVQLTGIFPGAPGESQPLTVSAFSANSDLIPDPTVAYLSPANAGYLFFHPRPNAYGTCEIIVLVDDGQPLNNLAMRMFLVRVVPRNDAPIISAIPAITTLEDTPVSVPLFVQDLESATEELQISVRSSNLTLIGPNGIHVTSSGSSRALLLQPATNQFGTAEITVTVTDPDGASSNATFPLNVAPVNDPPTLSLLRDINMMMNSLPAPVVLFGISAGAPNESQPLSITAFSSNPSVIPNPLVSYAQGAGSGLLTVTPALNAVGTATITVRVTEAPAGLSVTRTFNVTLSDFPSLLPSAPDEVTVASQMAEPIRFVAYDGEVEPDALVVRVSSLDSDLIPPRQIQISGEASRWSFSIVPARGRIGSTLVALTVECPSARVTKYIRVHVTKVLSVAAYNDAAD